jgi:2-dehydro-3-deoxygluconokinase
VIKDGDRQALVIDQDANVLAEPALHVEVMEPVGAGDAFAAGLLTGMVRGEPVARCLRRGHLAAAAVLRVHADIAAPPSDAQAAALLDASPADWAKTTIGPNGISGPVTVT